ncbi:MAG: hypothetical protein ABW328_14485 [Ilumatobacteraceae bacterium]
MASYKIPTLDDLPFGRPSFTMPSFSMPSVNIPNFEMPAFEMPAVDLPSAERVLGAVRDTAYVGVGLLVMTAERLQALQQQVVERLASLRPAA